ncbi:anti-sigma B factor RsbW [bacterium]|jgi:serine/threonine-protein kinase RsbW|nr:anti-sigma B factor RsbW [bacterium]
MKDKIYLKIPAKSEYVGVVRLAVSGIAARLDFSVEEIEDLKVAISEACTNSVQHAYEDGNGEIEITCFLSDKKLEITVKDEGTGFDVGVLGTQSQIEKSEERLGLGLGITFIKNLMDEATVHSVPGKSTEIHMVKSKK